MAASPTPTTGSNIPLATASIDGKLSKTDFAKLRDIEAEATKNSNTDELSESVTPTNKWFTNARAIASTLTGYVKASSVTAISSATTILQSIGILEKALDDKVDKVPNAGLITDAEKAIYADKYTQGETDNLIDGVLQDRVWKNNVATFADLATTYPTPEISWTSTVDNENMIYRYDGSIWQPIGSNNIPLATASLDGKLSSAGFTKLQNIEAEATKNTPSTTLQARTGTNDVVYMTPLKTVESIAERAGFGLEYNETTGKVEVGETTDWASGLGKQIDVGDIGEFTVKGGNHSQFIVDLAGNTDPSAIDSRGFQALVGNSFIKAFNNTVDIKAIQDGTQTGHFNVETSNVYIKSLFLQYEFSVYYDNGAYRLLIGNPNDKHLKLTYGGTDFEVIGNTMISSNAITPKSYVDTHPEKTAVETSRNLTAADFNGNNNILPVDSSSPVALNIPLNSTTALPLNTPLHIARDGSGTVEITGAGGVTFKSRLNGSGDIKIAEQYDIITIIQPQTNVWRVFGGLEG